jgi:hypothetical protein
VSALIFFQELAGCSSMYIAAVISSLYSGRTLNSACLWIYVSRAYSTNNIAESGSSMDFLCKSCLHIH